MAPKLLTVAEVSAELRVCQQTVRNMCADGRLKASKPTGGPWRIEETEIARVRTPEAQRPPCERPRVNMARVNQIYQAKLKAAEAKARRDEK